MNHRSWKLYKSLCGAIDCTAQWTKNTVQNSLFGRTIEYSGYLTRNWAPRMSYLDLYAPHYTPSKVKLNSYIVFGLGGVFFASEIALSLRERERARKHFEENR